MPRLRFTADFPWHARHNVTVMYLCGGEYSVTQACAEQALAKSKAVVVERTVAPAEGTRDANR